MKTQTVPAYAKLNLTLDILGKRPDGYHELRMVMQTVSLCDDVTVTLTDGTGVVCRVAGATLPSRRRTPSARRSAITAASTSRSPSASRPRPGWRAAARMPPPCCARCAI